MLVAVLVGAGIFVGQNAVIAEFTMTPAWVMVTVVLSDMDRAISVVV